VHQQLAGRDAWYAEMVRQHAQPGVTWVYACELKAPYGPDQAVFGPPDAVQLQHAVHGALAPLTD
jgi:hypothetical protein